MISLVVSETQKPFRDESAYDYHASDSVVSLLPQLK
jgi:hypothetical protein